MSRGSRAVAARWASLALGTGLLALGLLVSLLQRPEAAAPGVLRVRFLDVGQGDAILIDTPDGHHLLVDGGPSADSAVTVGHYLGASTELALVVATHNHADHIGGLATILDEYPVRSVWISGALHTSDTFLRWLNAVQRSGARVETVARGYEQAFGQVRLRVLHPMRDMAETRPGHQHDPTLVLKLSYGATSFLLTGDLEAEHEAALLAADRAAVRADVLKVTHHGSRYASTREFLEAVNPETAVISVGRENKFDHPHPETLERLGEREIPILRTDEYGTVTCTSDGLRIDCRGAR